jgi:membrane protein YdbS with pleckstrin-like domain
MRITDKNLFQPSNDALNDWLSTRKKVQQLAKKDIMPLFTDTDYTNDKKWWWIALSLELLGLLATIYGGLRSGGTFAIIAILVVVVFLFIDFVWIAPQLHKNEGVNNYRRAKSQILNKKSDNRQIRKLEDEINRGKGYRYFLIFLLVFMALIKTGAIILLGAFDSMIVYIAFLAIFLIIVYAHIYKTRYAIAYDKTQKQIDKDYHFYKNETSNQAKSYEQNFNTKVALEGVVINQPKIVEMHNIEMIGESNGTYLYRLNIKGVLTDDELLHQLCNNQEDSNALKIFLAGRKLQLERYGLGDDSSSSKKGSSLSDIDEIVDEDEEINIDLN